MGCLGIVYFDQLAGCVMRAKNERYAVQRKGAFTVEPSVEHFISSESDHTWWGWRLL